MFRYADTIKELHLEIEELSTQVEVLEQRLVNTAVETQPSRNWNPVRR